MNFLNRLAKIKSYLCGEFIVLMPEGDTLVVDCGTKDAKFIKNVATLFFKRAILN